MKLKKSLIKFKKKKNVDKEKLIYETNEYTYSFKNFQTISQGKKQAKEIVLKNVYNFFEGRGKILDALESKIFLTKSKSVGILNPDHCKLKVLTPKQMLQRLPIALALVKSGNNSESLLNQIRQIVCSLYQSKQITKKVYNNIIKSINIKMDTIFMNSENS